MKIAFKILFLFFILKIGINAEEDSEIGKIISLNSALTEAIYILKAQDKLIGCTIYCEKPKSDPKIVKLASTLSVNMEKILILEPDLLLTSGLTSQKTVKTLKKFNIKVASFAQPKTFKEICAQFIQLAKYVGKIDEAMNIVNIFQNKVDKLSESCAGFEKKKVFFQIGKNPFFTVHGGSYINDILEKLNTINIGKESRVGYFNLETVFYNDPEAIFYLSMLGSSEQERAFWLKFQNLKAVRNDRLFTLDTYEVCSASPESFYNIMRKISFYLYGMNSHV